MKTHWAGIAVALLGALPAAYSARAATKVAVIVPLSGPLAAAGREVEQTTRAWATQFNAKAGDSGVELLVLDDKSSADGAREAAQTALAHGAVLVLNCFGSVACMAIAQELKAPGVPLIGAIAGDDRLRGADFPHVFTTRGGARDEVEAILKYLHSFTFKDLVIVYQDDGFGQSYKRALDAQLSKYEPLRAVVTVAVDPKAPDYARAAAAATAQPSMSVVLLANTTHSLGVIGAMSAAGYRGLYFNLAAQANPLFVSEIGKLTANNKLVAAFVTMTPNPKHSAKDFDAYRENVTRIGQAAMPTYLGLEAFLNASLTAMVLQRDSKPTPQSLGKLLPTLDGSRVAGMTVAYDPTRRQVVRWLDLAVVGRDGSVRSY